MKAEDEKEPEGDRWPFQTMRNSGDKGGTRARMREGREWKEIASIEDESGGETKREREREIEKERERKRESERKVEGKIGATFSRKGRRGCNERWGKMEEER